MALKYLNKFALPEEGKEAEEILWKLIKEVNQHQNAHLEKARFDILFRTDERTKNNKTILASVRKTGGDLKALF